MFKKLKWRLDSKHIQVVVRFVFVVSAILFCAGISIKSWKMEDIKKSSVENRILKQFEEPTMETILSGEWFDNFEVYCEDQIISREQWVSCYYGIQDICLVKERNGYVLGDDSFVMNVIDSLVMDDAEVYVEKRMDMLLSIKDSVETYGGKLIYLNIPAKRELYIEKYPKMYETGEEINAARREQMLVAVRENGISCVETFDFLSERKEEYIYYATDHHYSVRGAYHVYNLLLNEMNQHGDVVLEFPEWSELEIKVNDERMAGSYLRKLGDSGLLDGDYMEYAMPKKIPEYERWDNGEKSEEGLYNLESNQYSSFMGGDIGNTVIRTNRAELPSVLYIGYSFTNALEMFSVYSFNEMHSIDPRHYEGNINDYIEEMKIDYVVVVKDDLYRDNENLKSTVR